MWCRLRPRATRLRYHPEVSESDSQSSVGPEIGEVSAADVLLFKVCVAAIWSDGSMAAVERDHLSTLMDRISASEDDRHELRRIALDDVSRSTVLTEVGGLDATGKRRLYERCISVLTADRKFRRGELSFVGDLRRRCDIGALHHQSLLWRAAPGRRFLRLVVPVVLVALVSMILWNLGTNIELRSPDEFATHTEIMLLQAPAGSPAMDSRALYEAIRHSVVKINVLIDEALVGHGSGVVIGGDGDGQLYVMTNRHVIYHEVAKRSRLSFEIQLENGIQLPAMLDFYSRNHDLAVVVAPGIGGWGLPVPLRMCSDLMVGEQIYAVGSPIGLDHSFTNGVISALRGSVVQIDATVHSGSSGGPIFDDRGRVCGIVTTSHMEKDFSFALCGETVLEMLDERLAAE